MLASFALVIALSLFLAGVVSVWLIRDQQAESAEKGIGRLVDPLSNQMQAMQLSGYPAERVAQELANLARYFEVRILLLDSEQRVVLDTNLRNPALGETIPEAADTQLDTGPGESYQSQRIRLLGEDVFLFTASSRGGAPVQLERTTGEVSLVVTVPATDVTSAWARLLPRLLIAGGLAAAFAAVVGTLLANRMTRPIHEMTRASEAMALGDYSQRIEVGDEDDEVAQLGRAFNQMAQQVDRSTRAMRQLLADVSHELKTPLTSIQGYSQAMVDGVLEPDELPGAAEVVHQESQRMRALVDDLLYLSQLETGQSNLALERIDLDAAAAATANRFRYQAEAAGVSIRLNLAGGPIEGDERRIEQVLANLLDNAIRFAPAGSAVGLRTWRDGGSIHVSVHNAGEPIPPEDLPHIFDRFYQVDPARTRNGHSGLGLAIVRELVQAHGGDVHAESTAASGTTFTVRLPAVAAEPAPASARRDEDVPPEAMPARA
ncbi:MAG: ATP-binding protein [Dehalococcoidia bacterium]